MDASNWTIPSSFGNPPYPTEVSLGSSSVTFADFSTASSKPPLFDRISQPGFKTFSPHLLPLLQIIIGPLLLFSFALIFKIKGAVAPTAAIFFINFLLELML